jgi:hypothetical protein
MPRRVEHASVTLTYFRDEQGNVIKQVGNVVYTTRDPSPAQNAKALDKQDFQGREPGPAYNGAMTLDELFTAILDTAKDQGKATS